MALELNFVLKLASLGLRTLWANSLFVPAPFPLRSSVVSGLSAFFVFEFALLNYFRVLTFPLLHPPR